MNYWRKPLDSEGLKIPHGNIQILRERCKGCGFCIEFCPRHVLDVSEEFNSRGYHPPYVKTSDGCVACGLCAMLCPEFAIYCIEEEQEVETL